MHVKYPRTPHLPHSLGATSDDKRLTSIAHFVGRLVVITEKMDGENTTLYRDGLHARSLDSRHHESRSWVKSFHAQVKYNIPVGWRVCGENLYARHSIAYESLPSYFLVFSIWDKTNRCLSWDDTLSCADEWGFYTVPVLECGEWDTYHIKVLWPNEMIAQGKEGFVVRLFHDSFHYRDFDRNVAKWVRANHVQTDEHWMNQPVIPNGLAKEI